MATVEVTELTDDLNGDVAHQTLTFSYGGDTYALDLSNLNYGNVSRQIASMEQKYARLVKAARRVTPKRTSTGGEAAQIREWARANGFEVGARGRLHSDILAAYEAANA